MKKSIGLVIIAIALNLVSVANAEVFNFLIPPSPLWTDTGINVAGGATISVTASGTWSTINGPDGPSGPDGLPLTGGLSGWSDGFLTGANKGVLLAYVGPDPFQGHWGDSSFFPHATGYWAVGSNGQFTAPSSGELWLGFNDDARSELVSDNSGSLTAQVYVVPEPFSGSLLGLWVVMGLVLRTCK